MATVFLSEDIHLGREVALKVFWPQVGETQDFLRRFTREARILAQLDHPNILPVYDYGEENGRAFLVVPYMAGGSLKDVLQQRKALPPSEAIQFISQVLPALQYAHDRNLIHRDIKPGNLLIKADGSLLIADFGLVKVLEGDEREGVPLHTISASGQIIAGTPEYMSPEQINGHAVAASDIYSLGVVLYEMVTGMRPFLGVNLLSVLVKHVNEAARPPRELNPYISPQLEAAILKALEKDPTRRFARPLDFLQALQQLGNPASSPGSINLPATNHPPSHSGLTTQGIYDPTRASSWSPAAPTLQAQASSLNSPLPPPFSGNQSAQMPISAASSIPGTPASPVAANYQASAGNPWQAMQGSASQAGGLPIGNSPLPPGGPFGPAPAPQQAFQPAHTVMQPFAPQQPRRSRAPVVVTLVMALLVTSIIAALFLTPLGPLLFNAHATTTPTPGQAVFTPASGLPGGRGGTTATPDNTQPLAQTTTACPASHQARAGVMASLALGDDPTIVYLVNENDASGSPTYGTVKLFDTVNGKKTELAKMQQTSITEAQISNDGQWVLFAAAASGQSQLRMVRMDGQGLQTLFCAPPGASIRYAQWSFDQRYVIFDVFPQGGEPTVYLLNIQSGALQVEVTPPASGTALIARTWLDNDHVLMTGLIPNSDAPQENIYILNLGSGAHQSMKNITQVFTSAQPCWDFDSSYDAQSLFITQCTVGAPDGTSTIGRQPVTGGSLSQIMSSPTLAVTTVRVIDRGDNTLLALASNTGPGTTGNQQHDGLYVVNTDGSGSPRLLTRTPAGAILSLNAFSQCYWANVSRNHTMYALETTKGSGSSIEYSLSYGQVSGGTPKAFTDYNQYMAIAGWTTT